MTAVLICTGPALVALNDFALAPPVPISLPAGSEPRDLRAFDVTGDGVVDLVVSSPLAPDARVLVGRGGVAFGAPVVSPMAAVDLFDLGDVNGDGRPDLVTIPKTDPQALTLQTHLGDGLGGFSSVGAVAIPFAGGVNGLALLDADEDGDLDALIEQGGALRLSLGDGAGGFGVPSLAGFSSNLALHQELHLLDVNGDGHLDVVGSGNAIFFAGWAVFLGDGKGAFNIAQLEYTSGDGDLYGSALSDFDGDHRTDFVLSGNDLTLPGDELAFAQGTGSTLVPPTPQSELAAPGHSRIRAGDLDRDGLGDVVGLVKKDGASKLWVLTGQGDFSFDAAQFVEVVNPFESMQDVALSDVDGDGVLDVLVLHDPGQISIFINQSPPSGWTDLGHGLPGSDGVPSLLGQGELQFSSPGSLKLTHANPDKLAVLFVGPSANPTPFKGGALVPIPVTMAFMLGTSPTGSITLPWNSWPHLPPGTDYFFQYAIVDSAGPAGASLSNAVRALQP